jgi:phosphosulfolactate synthase
MQADLPFGFVPIDPRRSLSKPRRTGLSMVIDDGLPLSYARDVLDLAAPYIDLMKIKTGTARLYPRDALVRKLALYEELGVQPFLGGQFHEYVFSILGEVALTKFYAEARALGFRAIEISDNTVPLTPQQRRNQITAAIASGLTVFGEVGSKETLSNPALLIEQAEVCLNAGAGSRGSSRAGGRRPRPARQSRSDQARATRGPRHDRAARSLDLGCPELRY